MNTSRIATLLESGTLTRRAFLRRATLLAVSVPVASSLFAACADDVDDDEEPAAPGDDEVDDADPVDDDDDEEVEVTDDDVDDAEEVDDDDVEATEGGTLTAALHATLVSLDPHGAQAVEAVTQTMSNHLYDSVLVRDPDTGEFEPSLATDWEVQDDTIWTINLRDDVTYHNGDPLTADDVVRSLERILELGGPLEPLWPGVESIDAVDDTTVEIVADPPLGTVPANLSILFVTPAELSDDEEFFNEPIGSGPFRFVNWAPDDELVLERNDDYWDGAPYLDQLVFREIPEVASLVTAIETGEIDFTLALPPDQLPALEDNPDLTVDTVESFTYYFNWFNAQREPFDDVRVRQAMCHALDIDSMVNDLLAGMAERATAPIPPTVFGWAEQDPYEYDPDRAMELLEEAGYPDGFETTIQWNPGSGPQDRELVLTMISNWAAIGVTVENLEKERAQWLDDLLELNWDMNFQTNTVRTGDADFTLRRLYHSEANRNGYGNPDLDEVLTEAAQEVDQDRREELYAEACQIIWDEAVGIFPFDLLENYIYRNRVTGFVAPPTQAPIFTDVQVSD